IEPFQSQSSVTFTMAPETPTTTKVTWAMDGKHNFVSKAFSVVKPMDGMIGKDFEEGLANLKKVAEAKKPPPPRNRPWPPSPPRRRPPRSPQATPRRSSGGRVRARHGFIERTRRKDPGPAGQPGPRAADRGRDHSR